MKGRLECRKYGSRAAALWLMLPLLVLVVLKIDFLPQVARFSETRFTKVADEMVHKVSSLGLDVAKSEAAEDSIVRPPPSAASRGEITGNVVASKDPNQQNQVLRANRPKDSSLINSHMATRISKLTCNFSNYHTNTCTMEGDLRIHGKSATVYVVSASTFRPENSTIKVRPYARKWEKETMSKIREVTMRSSPPAANTIVPPQCTVRHYVPAVVFSTGAYSTNYFHSMSDIIVPLYITAREYNGRVQLLATDYDSKWVAKYRPILAALSIYPVIDFDADTAVRCFPSAHVGLESHKILGIDPGLSRNGYTTMGFRDFLRWTYSLQRSWATPISRSSGQKPRLVMVLRRHSRALTNEADAIASMTDLGFDVVAAGPEDVRDMDRIAGVVNSCDVMVGVHGAGLTNMVFLPHNGTIVQIIPWGGMKWPCWYDFGQPVPDMGLRYVEYEAIADETTLKHKYPRDHPVFTDPMSIHRKGFRDVWKTFLDGQNVTLDIDRFRGVMQQVYLSITTE
ncbi:alpha-1,3-arabinosyltransferase XAT2-like [Phragmites australis]|uniref:alpha-1,3-arabinosyltransferase XAT2-like n=1 Tax=Phragmites australis TaxID=29695 RepID=UPI002D788615|nr:alpha-1,3-arabinosyltransferase XAT2-like [Phragmites australis]